MNMVPQSNFPRALSGDLLDGYITYRLITGAIVKREHVVGQCYLLAHPGYLTKRLVDEHECLQKQCPLLKKLEHPYWQHLERMAEKKAMVREEAKKQKMARSVLEDYVLMMLEASGHVYVTSIKDGTYRGRRQVEITYIYDEQVDLSEEIAMMKETLQSHIWLRANRASPEVKERIFGDAYNDAPTFR